MTGCNIDANKKSENEYTKHLITFSHKLTQQLPTNFYAEKLELISVNTMSNA